METVSQLLVVVGVALSFYGALQLGTRSSLGEEKLTPLFSGLSRILRGDVPRDCGGESDVFLDAGRKDRVGWFCLTVGFLFQLIGAALPLFGSALRVAVAALEKHLRN